MPFTRTKCRSPHCPAMACPSQTGYCSHHDLGRTPYGKRPGEIAPALFARVAEPPVPKFVWQMPQGNA